MLSFISFENNKLAFQILDSENQEIFFFYADLETNELAFRSGSSGDCSISQVPDLLKVDLINFPNLWDYLFFFQASGHWAFQWPFGSNLLNNFLSELHYFADSNQKGASC